MIPVRHDNEADLTDFTPPKSTVLEYSLLKDHAYGLLNRLASVLDVVAKRCKAAECHGLE